MKVIITKCARMETYSSLNVNLLNIPNLISVANVNFKMRIFYHKHSGTKNSFSLVNCSSGKTIVCLATNM